MADANTPPNVAKLTTSTDPAANAVNRRIHSIGSNFSLSSIQQAIVDACRDSVGRNERRHRLAIAISKYPLTCALSFVSLWVAGLNRSPRKQSRSYHRFASAVAFIHALFIRTRCSTANGVRNVSKISNQGSHSFRIP